MKNHLSLLAWLKINTADEVLSLAITPIEKMKVS